MGNPSAAFAAEELGSTVESGTTDTAGTGADSTGTTGSETGTETGTVSSSAAAPSGDDSSSSGSTAADPAVAGGSSTDDASSGTSANTGDAGTASQDSSAATSATSSTSTDSSQSSSASSSDSAASSTSLSDEELFTQGGGYLPYIQTFVHPKNVNLPETVTRYLPWVERYCAENNISEYVPYAMAIMNNESGGTTMDVMGCKGEDPYDSVKEGCRIFALCLDDAKKAGADINSAVQGYNYGTNFCFYVGSAGGIYTQSLSDMYAYDASGGEKIPFPNSLGFGWIYNYGCQYYVGLTMSYLEEMTEEDLAAYNEKQKAKETDYVVWLREFAEEEGHGYSDLYYKGTKNVNDASLIYLALQNNGYLVGEKADCPFDRESIVPTITRHGFVEVPEAETDYMQMRAGDILIGDSVLAIFVGDGCIVNVEDTEDAVAIRDVPIETAYKVYRCEKKDEPLNDYTAWMVEHAYDDVHGYALFGRNDPDVNESSFVYYALASCGYLEGEDRTEYFEVEEEPEILLRHGFAEVTDKVISAVPNAGASGEKSNSSALHTGDILIGANGENAVYLNGGRFVYAQDARKSLADYGAGDQSGHEVIVGTLDGVQWIHVFRLEAKDEQREEKSITGTLSWTGESESEHPAEISILLVADGKAVRKITVPVQDGYTYSFAGVDADKEYSIYSEDIPGYQKTYDGFNVSYKKEA